MRNPWTRREFLAHAGMAATGSAFSTSPLIAAMAQSQGSAERGDEHGRHKAVIVLGFDGMDPRLCEQLMDAGRLPNLARMRQVGGYCPLGTSIPPQSPVAWSNFITGANPGVHGIFDFIHRDPKMQCLPYYSGAETVGGEKAWEVGEHRIPLSFWPFNHVSPRTVLLRRGTPFWDYLDEAGVPVCIYDIPAHYPPSPSTHGHVRCLSGMGVPDLLGSYGTYQYFSQDTRRVRQEGGGIRKPLLFIGDTAMADLTGPRNTYLKKPVDTRADFQVFRHPSKASARIDLQGQTILLAEGEWSDWCSVDFELKMPSFLPNSNAAGICRFYLQEVRPKFRLYASPINMDPRDMGYQKITEPGGFAGEIAGKLGPFYTTGFQEDHKALSNGIFSDEEFRHQADYVFLERKNLLQYAIDHYVGGLLFFDFSSTDLQAHMFLWDTDEPHPVRTPAQAQKCHEVIADLYGAMDKVVGDVLARVGDEATVIVMSDHGFSNFRRQFNLNTWLRDHGYIQPSSCKSILIGSGDELVDWRGTKAYGLGINGLYLNLEGRERNGIVTADERDALLGEITEKLLAVRDPENGHPVIASVYRADQVYAGSETAKAPDLIIGYHRGYRASWSTTLGDIHDQAITDNDSAWSADHCFAAEEIPGVIFSNRPILRENPSLVDLAPTILEEYGLEPSAVMRGGNVFRPTATAAGEMAS